MLLFSRLSVYTYKLYTFPILEHKCQQMLFVNKPTLNIVVISQDYEIPHIFYNLLLILSLFTVCRSKYFLSSDLSGCSVGSAVTSQAVVRG